MDLVEPEPEVMTPQSDTSDSDSEDDVQREDLDGGQDDGPFVVRTRHRQSLGPGPRFVPGPREGVPLGNGRKRLLQEKEKSGKVERFREHLLRASPRARCPECHGSGKVSSYPCPKCRGIGTVRLDPVRDVPPQSMSLQPVLEHEQLTTVKIRQINVECVHGRGKCRRCNSRERHLAHAEVTDDIRDLLGAWEKKIEKKEHDLRRKLLRQQRSTLLSIHHAFGASSLSHDFMMGAARAVYDMDGKGEQVFEFVAVSGGIDPYSGPTMRLDGNRWVTVATECPKPGGKFLNVYGVEFAMNTTKIPQAAKPCAAIKLLIAIGRKSQELRLRSIDQLVRIELGERAHALFAEPPHKEPSDLVRVWSTSECVVSCEVCSPRVPQLLCECSCVDSDGSSIRESQTS